MAHELTWEDINKIGITLSNTHPAIEPDKVELSRLHAYVIQLSEFKGDPEKFDEQKLQAIRSAWITEFLERTRNWA
jgi:FeS assembly protein IscX